MRGERMQPQVEDSPPAGPRRRMSRRGTGLGSLIALLVLAGLGWLAWDLTHQPPAPAAGAPGAGGPGGPGGGAGRGRGGTPPTTVGVATATRADVPITLEALGTVTPTATAIVRPQVT